MTRAHQPGSQPIDVPEAIPNPAVPQPARDPSPRAQKPDQSSGAPEMMSHYTTRITPPKPYA